MAANDMFEKNISSPSFNILNAPKIKFEKPTISPTPFSLNDDPFLDQENHDSDSNDTNDSKYNSFDEENINYMEDIKTQATSFSLKIQKCVKQ